MSARTKARKRALDLLFASEVRGRSVVDALEEEVADARSSAGRPVADYTGVLVRGVAEHARRIDEILAMYAEGWSLKRMPSVDRNVLRLGVYELLWADDVPDAVAVSEALNLARDLSTDESPAFVNGVLGAVVRDQTVLRADDDTDADQTA